MKLTLRREDETLHITDDQDAFRMTVSFAEDLSDANGHFHVSNIELRMQHGSPVTDVEIFRALAKILEKDDAQFLPCIIWSSPRFYEYSLRDKTEALELEF